MASADMLQVIDGLSFANPLLDNGRVAVLIAWLVATTATFYLLKDRARGRCRAFTVGLLSVFGLLGVVIVECLTFAPAAAGRGFAVLTEHRMEQAEGRVVVSVRFFAAARDAVGAGETSLALNVGASAAAAFALLAGRYPALTPLLARSRAAVNQEYVATTHVLADGDELAVIPPVSGG